MQQLLLRTYRVTGTAVHEELNDGDTAEQIDSFTTTVSHLKNFPNLAEHLLISFDAPDDESCGYFRVKKSPARKIKNALTDSPERYWRMHEGGLVRSTRTGIKRVDDDLHPVAAQPVETTSCDPGLTLTLGHGDEEGATAEFTPAQTDDFIDLLEVFTDASVEIPSSNPTLTPTEVYSDGTADCLLD